MGWNVGRATNHFKLISKSEGIKISAPQAATVYKETWQWVF